jgi:hypothetical protein
MLSACCVYIVKSSAMCFLSGSFLRILPVFHSRNTSTEHFWVFLSLEESDPFPFELERTPASRISGVSCVNNRAGT